MAIVCCQCSTDQGAAGLSDRLEAAANRMTLLNERVRTVDYSHFRDEAYWIAFLPSGMSPDILVAKGVPLSKRASTVGCTSDNSAVIILADATGTQCVTHDRISIASLVLLKKNAGQESSITITLDADGYHLTKAE
jgi:hypothetical protein